MKRVALVGSGSIADQHLGALLEIPTAQVVGVYSRTEEKAKKAADKARCQATTDWKALVGRADVDVVDIVTSSGSTPKSPRPRSMPGSTCSAKSRSP